MVADLSWLSPGILGLIAFAVIALGLCRGLLRQLAFLGINAVFLDRFLLGHRGFASTLAFLGVGYLLIRVAARLSDRGFKLALAGFVLLFGYMQHYEILTLVLPDAVFVPKLATIGLSFLFFKIIHVAIEARSQTIGPVDVLTYANYGLNFAGFMMGPIQRFQDYRAQWTGEKAAIPPTFEAHLDAVLRVLLGFCKAYVFAEWVRPYALGPGASELPLGELWVSVYVFYFYLYLNFSGYCDIVIGAGSLFGVRPPENFHYPFIARNPSDFWNRQHISLTNWLTDFVFTPVFKSLLQTEALRKHGLLAANTALIVTMVVSGLWHGTTIAFLLFGILHGIYLVIYRSWDHLLTKKLGKKRVRAMRKTWWSKAIGIALTFNAVAIAFVFFRLDAKEGLVVIGRLFTP